MDVIQAASQATAANPHTQPPKASTNTISQDDPVVATETTVQMHSPAMIRRDDVDMENGRLPDNGATSDISFSGRVITHAPAACIVM